MDSDNVEDIEALDCNLSDVIASAKLLLLRPHLIDNKLAGCKILEVVKMKHPISDPQRFAQSSWCGDFVTNNDKANEIPFDSSRNFLVFRHLVLRKSSEVVIDSVIWTSEETDGTLRLVFQNMATEGEEKLGLWWSLKYEHAPTKTLSFCYPKRAPEVWTCLVKKVRSKFVKWCQDRIGDSAPSEASLKLVSIDKYSQKYQALKDKYMSKLIEAWKTETTNPEKFIHEDLGIATYLLLIWEQESVKPSSFVDLGCGNGLLVYLLTQEGFPGVGLDLRKRKIWQFFRENGTDLRVETIQGKADDCFQEYDWLIGNHSDELTPWIPVMARLSRSKFFLLPCCPFDFYAKFQRSGGDGQQKSTYRDYLDFVANVGQKCGFKMEEDKLRIPSTKRICFIGRTRIDGQVDHDFIEKLASETKDFVPRPVDEKVRNCTKVDKSVTSEIIDTLVKGLLKDNDSEFLMKDTEQAICDVQVDRWNKGTTWALAKVSEILSPELKAKLKSECGGLQTLLRNHNHIFVVERGTVRLRCPALDDHSRGKKRPTAKSDLAKFKKRKQCWFHENHPQGCPISSQDCFWAHGAKDLCLNI